MSIELITFIVMIAVFLLGCFAAKLPVSISMVLSAIAGALVGGEGVPCVTWSRVCSPTWIRFWSLPPQ